MTPERKKKLRTLLRKKAAEELKKEQERKAEERLRVIAGRCGTKADLDAASMDDLKKICQQYFDKWYSLEGEMFFLQRGHPPRPPDQRAHHLEGLQVREQVRQAAGEGSQVRLCQPAEAVQGLSRSLLVTMTDSIPGQWRLATTS